MTDTNLLIQKAVELGATAAGVIAVKDILFEPEYRKLCESNACGKFGTNWMCPPHVGDIHELIAQAKGYEKGLVFQSVYTLEDSYDFEGMMQAGKEHKKLTITLRDELMELPSFEKYLMLGSGSCGVCKPCEIKNDKPCPYPERAIPSLEAYGIAVSELAALADMKYMNGQDTVTYFAMFLYEDKKA